LKRRSLAGFEAPIDTQGWADEEELIAHLEKLKPHAA
jgi:hypothetical protein